MQGMRFANGRKLWSMLAALAVSFVGVVGLHAQPANPPPASGDDGRDKLTFTTQRAFRPFPSSEGAGGHPVFFMDRQKMKGRDFEKIAFAPNHKFMAGPALPIDWAKDLQFPMNLNNQYGDCYYAAGCHGDNTYSGCAGVESFFSLPAIRARYFALSGGDNGLNDSDMQGEMMNRFLADVPAAKIVSWANVQTTDAQAVQLALQRYGVVYFTFAVAPAWIRNSGTAAEWDAASYTNNNNGHAVIFNGCDVKGRYKLQTWGTYVWLTPAGLRVCQPGGWVAFSARWFDARGYAPNRIHITELAKQWQADTGKVIPPSIVAAFPPPDSPPPPPPPPPGNDVISWTINGVTSSFRLVPLVPKDAAKEPR